MIHYYKYFWKNIFHRAKGKDRRLMLATSFLDYWRYVNSLQLSPLQRNDHNTLNFFSFLVEKNITLVMFERDVNISDYMMCDQFYCGSSKYNERSLILLLMTMNLTLIFLHSVCLLSNPLISMAYPLINTLTQSRRL